MLFRNIFPPYSIGAYTLGIREHGTRFSPLITLFSGIYLYFFNADYGLLRHWLQVRVLPRSLSTAKRVKSITRIDQMTEINPVMSVAITSKISDIFTFKLQHFDFGRMVAGEIILMFGLCSPHKLLVLPIARQRIFRAWGFH